MSQIEKFQPLARDHRRIELSLSPEEWLRVMDFRAGQQH
jgi:hypothetical protein